MAAGVATRYDSDRDTLSRGVADVSAHPAGTERTSPSASAYGPLAPPLSPSPSLSLSPGPGSGGRRSPPKRGVGDGGGWSQTVRSPSSCTTSVCASTAGASRAAAQPGASTPTAGGWSVTSAVTATPNARRRHPTAARCTAASRRCTPVTVMA